MEDREDEFILAVQFFFLGGGEPGGELGGLYEGAMTLN